VHHLIAEDGRRIAASWPIPTDELENSRIAISGATGLIGQHLVAVLLGLNERFGLGLQITALGRNLARLHQAFPETQIAKRAGAIDNPDSWPAATHLVHAASPATPKLFAEDLVGVVRANVLGTMAALDSARKSGAHVTLVSTMEIYGQTASIDGDVVLREGTIGALDPFELRSAYPESKRLAENLLVGYAEQYGVRSDSVRVSHTYGPGTKPDDDRVQVGFMKQAVAGEPIVLRSDGKLRRSYTYAADSAAAIVAVLSTAGQRGKPQAWNVADNNNRISIRELAEASLRAAGRREDELRFELDGTKGLWAKTPSGTFLDTSKLESLGWKPQFYLAKGLNRMGEYLKS
jgi:dTDP-glucose 4,6-dehydratase